MESSAMLLQTFYLDLKKRDLTTNQLSWSILLFLFQSPGEGVQL